MNQNLNSFAVASTVIANSGSTPFTDPYPYGPNLNIYGPGKFSPGTNAAIIAGTYVTDGSGNPLTFAWRTRSQNEMDKGSSYNQNLPVNSAYLASDILNMSGQKAGSDFVMQMDFTPEVEGPSDQFYDIQANKALYLGMLVNQNGVTTWANAVSENIANTVSQTIVSGPFHQRVTQTAILPSTGAYAWHPQAGNWVDSSQPSSQPYIGSFQSFLNSTYLEGGQTHYFYEHSLDELRGTWGIDTSTDTAWAVLDVGNGIFAVVPEPATIRLLAACLMTVAVGFWWRRRSRIKVARIAGAVKAVAATNSVRTLRAAA